MLDKSPVMCYNNYSEREVRTMKIVTWKYINESEVHASVMTSREAYNFRLSPLVEVLKIEDC